MLPQRHVRDDQNARGDGSLTTSDPPEAYPRTIRFCVLCREYTAHELRPAGVLCFVCATSVLEHELERD